MVDSGSDPFTLIDRERAREREREREREMKRAEKGKRRKGRTAKGQLE